MKTWRRNASGILGLSVAMAVCLVSVPAAVKAAMPVIDVNAVSQWITQLDDQLKQIQQLSTQINQAQQNLATYSTAGQWTQIAQRIGDLQSQIATAQKTSQISGNVADTQIAQMNSELQTITQLEQLANSSTGNLQAQQAQSRLQAEIISQMAELRQLELAQIKQTQIDQTQALQRYHATTQDPSTY